MKILFEIRADFEIQYLIIVDIYPMNVLSKSFGLNVTLLSDVCLYLV